MPAAHEHPTDPLLRICLVQAYRAPSYIRGSMIKAGVVAAGGSASLYLAMNYSTGIRRYWEAIQGLLLAKRQHDPAVYILAFRGHEIAWLVRWLTRGRVMVFDAMMSPYAALLEERKFGLVGRALANLWRPVERAALNRADAILTDTEAHSKYFQTQFGVPASKIIVTPVGAMEPAASASRRAQAHNELRILFYGSFLPLHGIDCIIDAATLLRDLPVFFVLIGGNKRDARKLARRLGRSHAPAFSHRLWVPFEDLLNIEIPTADLCLGGPFGNTPQSQRVVTGKTHQFLASGKATVVGAINEECGFIDKSNCLLVRQGDPAALAEAIRWAYHNRERLPAIGEAGRDLHRTRYSAPAIGARLIDALARLAGLSSQEARA